MSVLFTVDLSLHCDSRVADNCLRSASFSMKSSRADAKSAAWNNGWYVGREKAICRNCRAAMGKKRT